MCLSKLWRKTQRQIPHPEFSTGLAWIYVVLWVSSSLQSTPANLYIFSTTRSITKILFSSVLWSNKSKDWEMRQYIGCLKKCQEWIGVQHQPQTCCGFTQCVHEIMFCEWLNKFLTNTWCYRYVFSIDLEVTMFIKKERQPFGFEIKTHRLLNPNRKDLMEGDQLFKCFSLPADIYTPTYVCHINIKHH